MKEPRIRVGKDRKRKIHGKEAYYEYLKSEAWIKKKKFILNNTSQKHRCFCCWRPYKVGEIFDFHHKTYETLGNERAMDLILVCRTCHNEIHRIVASGRMHLWGAARVLKRQKMHELKKAYGLAKMRDLRKWLREGSVSLTELL